jgi:hypothetical protein
VVTEMARERHWDASDASDFEVEHEIYREGERIRGRHYIHASSQTRRVLRSGEHSRDLFVTEFVLMYHLTR